MATKVTEVEYNGVNLGQVRTMSFVQEPIYDNESHTDMIGMEYKMTFQFLFAVDDEGVGFYGPVSVFKDVNDDDEVLVQKTFTRLRLTLEQPRKKFVLTQNGEKLIDTSADRKLPKQDDWDDFNGPIPGALRLVGMFAKRVMLLEWSCSVKLSFAEVLSQSLGDNPVPLSIKYTQSQDIDERGYSTITTQGSLKATAPVFRNAKFDAPATVDSLRLLCLPVLLPNYRRRSRYQVSADGTTLHFSFTDRQLDTMPPDPAFEASGNFGISGSGGIWHGEISLTLKGGKKTNKQKLLETAIAICLTRIIRTTGADPNNVNAWNALWGKAHGGVSFREELFDNTISVAMRFLIPPKNLQPKQVNGAALIGQRVRAGVAGAAQLGVVPFMGLAGFAVGGWLKQQLGFLGLGNQVQQGARNALAGAAKWVEARKAEGKADFLENNAAGNAMPGIAVPNDAIKQIGTELPGVYRYNKGIMAGGVRGVDDPVLLVAGFMRDPAIKQEEVVNPINFSGIRGPIKLDETKVFEPVNDTILDPVGQAFQVGQAAIDAIAGGLVGIANYQPTPEMAQPVIGEPVALSASQSMSFASNASLAADPVPTSNGWFTPGNPQTNSDGMTVEYLTGNEPSLNDPAETKDAYGDGIYSFYLAEMEYVIDGRDVIMYPSGGDGVATVHRLYQKEPAYAILRFKAVKSGSPPTVPFKNVDQTEDNLVYATSHLVAGQLELGDDGTPTYTLTGWVKYWVKDSDKLALRPPIPPYLPVKMEDVTAGYFDDSLLNITAS